MFISGHFIGGSWSSRSVFSRQGLLGIYRRRGSSGLEAAGHREAEVARQEVEAARQEEEVPQEATRQPVRANKRQTGGEASANKRQRHLESQRVCREDKRRWWRCNERHHNNQPGYMRQTGGVAPANKRRQHLESRPCLETMRGKGCTARGKKKEAVRRKDKRQRWRWSDKMQCNNQPGQTKGEREADDPATAKQKTVAMISRRKFGRRGEDTTMDDYNEKVMIKNTKNIVLPFGVFIAWDP